MLLSALRQPVTLLEIACSPSSVQEPVARPGVDYQEAVLAQLGIQEECRTIFWDDVERFSQVNRSEPAG